MASAVQIAVGFPLRVVAFPAPDVPGEWLVISLDLDIMAQGGSADEALNDLQGSLSEMIAFRLSRGLSPVEWRPAPDEFWRVAEAATGQALDRTPPKLEFSTANDMLADQSQVSLTVTDRAPVRVAHAG